MLDFIYYLFSYGSIISFFIPVLVFCTVRKTLIKENSALFTLVFFNLCFTFLAILSQEIYTNCYPAYHVSTPILTLLTINYFWRKGISTFIAVISASIVLLLFIYESIYLNNWFENNLLIAVFSNMCISMLSLYHLYIIFTNENENENNNQFKSLFFISSGLFISNTSSFFFSLNENKIRSEDYLVLFQYVFPVFMFIYILQNALISWGIWTTQKRS
jgi:hypothetical protein